MASLDIKKEPGIGDDDTQAGSRPLDAGTPLSGPPLWTAVDENRHHAFGEGGLSVHQHEDYQANEPAPLDTGPYPVGRLAPPSVTGTDHGYMLPNADGVGFKHQRPNDPPINNGGHSTPDNPELC